MVRVGAGAGAWDWIRTSAGEGPATVARVPCNPSPSLPTSSGPPVPPTMHRPLLPLSEALAAPVISRGRGAEAGAGVGTGAGVGAPVFIPRWSSRRLTGIAPPAGGGNPWPAVAADVATARVRGPAASLAAATAPGTCSGANAGVGPVPVIVEATAAGGGCQSPRPISRRRRRAGLLEPRCWLRHCQSSAKCHFGVSCQCLSRGLRRCWWLGRPRWHYGHRPWSNRDRGRVWRRAARVLLPSCRQ
jgi:hypothetical protein